MYIIHVRLALVSLISGNISSSVLTCNQIININYSQSSGDILTPDGLGGGDKHSVVDFDRNSAKHNNINIGCKDITSIISRYFRTAGTWRGVFEPSTAASDE